MPRILIIEDDPLTLMLLQEIMESVGYDVETAENGKQGLFKYMTQDIDLVITDIFMPEMDGFETILALKNICEHVKIITISGADKYFLDAAKHMGTVASFHKPVNHNALLDKVEEILSIS